MTGVVLVGLVSVLCAAAVVGLLAAGHRPEEGWQEWLRESVDAWRSDEPRPLDAEETAENLDLFSLGQSEPGTGYAHPDELRVRRHRDRQLTQR